MKKPFILLLFSLNLFSEVFPKLDLIPLKDSENINFNSIKEEYILINFWASWCVPCRIELAEMEKFKKEINKDKIKIIGISLDENKNIAEEFIKKFNLSFPIYHLEKKNQNQIILTGIPANFLIDKNMEVIKKWEGYDPSIFKEIKKIIGK